MKILLINPAFDYYSPNLLIKEPLSLAYLAAYLKKYDYKIEILDAAAGRVLKKQGAWHYGLYPQEIAEKIKDYKPDIVGIACPFSLRIKDTLEIARLAKKINTKIITVVGGIHPSTFPLETVSLPEIDYVIIGEGEESFVSLMRFIETGNAAVECAVDGCAFKDGGKATVIPKTAFIENLDSIPFPARDLLPMEFYLHRPSVLYGLGSHRAVSLITSRGCPYHCAFCSLFQFHGRKWRGRSAGNVCEEIETLLKNFNVKEIFFMDDNLTIDKKRIIDLCTLILKKGLRFKWNTPNGVSAKHLSSEVVTLMKKAGCINICIGIESGNEVVRNEIMGKELSEELIRNALDICKRAGLPVVGFFILGTPGENEERFNDTLQMVKNLPFDMVASSFFVPLPGTKLYEECIRNGFIDKDFFKHVGRFNIPIVETPDFDKKTLRGWEKKFYFTFFKSHFCQLTLTSLRLRNSFLNWHLLKRFINEKFNF